MSRGARANIAFHHVADGVIGDFQPSPTRKLGDNNPLPFGFVIIVLVGGGVAQRIGNAGDAVAAVGEAGLITGGTGDFSEVLAGGLAGAIDRSGAAAGGRRVLVLGLVAEYVSYLRE